MISTAPGRVWGIEVVCHHFNASCRGGVVFRNISCVGWCCYINALFEGSHGATIHQINKSSLHLLEGFRVGGFVCHRFHASCLGRGGCSKPLTLRKKSIGACSQAHPNTCWNILGLGVVCHQSHASCRAFPCVCNASWWEGEWCFFTLSNDLLCSCFISRMEPSEDCVKQTIASVDHEDASASASSFISSMESLEDCVPETIARVEHEDALAALANLSDVEYDAGDCDADPEVTLLDDVWVASERICAATIEDSCLTVRKQRGLHGRAAQRMSAQELAKGLPMDRQRRVLVQKASRVANKFDAYKARTSMQAMTVQKAWNHGRLRMGDRLADAGDVRKKQGTWRHSKSWTMVGTLDVAFSSIGAATPSASSLRRTRRELDAIAAAALSHQKWQSDNLKIFGLKVQSGVEAPRWIFVERAWDASPVVVKFGNLRADLAPIARYWYKHQQKDSSNQAKGTWTLLSQEGFKQRTGPPTQSLIHSARPPSFPCLLPGRNSLLSSQRLP